MTHIANEFDIKNNEWGPPKHYLGAEIKKVIKYYTDSTGAEYARPRDCWSMSSAQYVENAIKTIEDIMDKDDLEFKSKKNTNGRQAKGCFPTNYKPELDTTPELDDEKASIYRQIIGILRWAIELN